MGKIS